MKVKTNHTLKAEVEAAVMAEVLRVGATGFAKDSVVRQFLDRGTSRSTLYAWVDKALASGRPGQVLARAVKDAVEERAARTPEPVAEVVTEIAAHLPVTVRPGQVIGMPTINLVDKLGAVIANLEALIAHAKDEMTGKIRNAKLLLTASDRLRASLETAIRLYQAIRDIDQIDNLHRAILDEIGHESPELAERVLKRIVAVSSRWETR
jgi:hypothetical protein